ncbi:MAG: hypothetical protein HYZ50_14085 [Deltaproteobacteria bacterium]|nr:hypothetical protein [Deltaproteobacteria bacterium]
MTQTVPWRGQNPQVRFPAGVMVSLKNAPDESFAGLDVRAEACGQVRVVGLQTLEE